MGRNVILFGVEEEKKPEFGFWFENLVMEFAQSFFRKHPKGKWSADIVYEKHYPRDFLKIYILNISSGSSELTDFQKLQFWRCFNAFIHWRIHRKFRRLTKRMGTAIMEHYHYFAEELIVTCDI